MVGSLADHLLLCCGVLLLLGLLGLGLVDRGRVHKRDLVPAKINCSILSVPYITANHATFPIRIHAITVSICGNF